MARLYFFEPELYFAKTFGEIEDKGLSMLVQKSGYFYTFILSLMLILNACSSPDDSEKDAKATASAPENKTIEFKFAPKDGLSFVQTQTLINESSIGSSGTRVNETKYVTRLTFKETKSGWDVLVEPIETVLKQDGEIIENPLVKSYSEAVLTYKLSPEGKILDVDGFESVTKALVSQFPEESVEKMKEALSVDVLKQKVLLEWADRYGDFVGKKVTSKDKWEKRVPVSLPNNVKFEYTVNTSFPEFKNCGERECIKVLQEYDSSAEKADPSTHSLAFAAGRNFEAVKDDAGTIKGSLERLVDPNTMMIYEENMYRETTFKLSIPPDSIAPVRVVEKQKFEYKF